MRSVLVDSGPLVAALDRSDRRHAWAVDALKSARTLTTVWPVVTEVSHLLNRRGFPPARGLLAALIDNGAEIAPLDQNDFEPVAFLMTQYEDLPMDLADAALVHAYHRERFDAVLTTDVRDFSVYRVAGKPLRLITPAA